MDPIKTHLKLELLSCAFVLTDGLDAKKLSELQTHFAETITLADSRLSAVVAGVANKAIELIDAVLGQKSGEAEKYLECVGHAISALQAILRDGRDPDETIAWFNGCLAAIDESVVEQSQHDVEPEEKGGHGPDGPPSLDLAPNTDADLYVEFVAEANEHLESIETHVLILDKQPGDVESLNALFRAFHTIKGVAAHLELGDIAKLAHETENLLDHIRDGEIGWDSNTVDIVFQAGDVMKRLLDRLKAFLQTGGEMEQESALAPLLGKICRLVAGNGRTNDGATPEPQTSSEAPRASIRHPQDTVGPREGISPSPAGGARRKPEPATVKKREFIRVDAERLEKLVETIGELVTSVTVLGQFFETSSAGVKDAVFKQVEKNARALQELGTSLQMVPLRSTFRKMKRMIRDLSRQAGKNVNLIVSGEDVELDKTLVERIHDPLLHLIRNAVDHGIESDAAMRRKLGKPDCGVVNLRAYHQGGYIYIEIEDDGQGLDRDQILSRARSQGLLRDEDNPADSDLYNLIFVPGFTTSPSVSEVSGRGVGMDVVKRNLEATRGSIDIDTEPGCGTRFTIRLPLTVAIIDGMVVRVGTERYIFPTSSIVRLVQPDRNDLTTVLESEEYLRLEDSLIPIYHLGAFLDVEGAKNDPTEGIVVVVENAGKQIGFLTDDLIGQQQIVIKSLGCVLHDMPGIAGGAIMADGKIGLILDIDGLARLRKETTKLRPGVAV